MMDIEYGSTTDVVDSGSQCANFKVRKILWWIKSIVLVS